MWMVSYFFSNCAKDIYLKAAATVKPKGIFPPVLIGLTGAVYIIVISYCCSHGMAWLWLGFPIANVILSLGHFYFLVQI